MTAAASTVLEECPWPIVELGECLVSTPSYGINAAAVHYRHDLPTYIRITDIDGEGRFSPNPRVSVRDPAAADYFLEPGDIVLARTGASVGKSYLHRPEDGRLVFAGFLIRVRVDDRKLDPQFLAQYLRSKPYWDWVEGMSVRSGQPGINSGEYASLPVPRPEMPEQRRVASVLDDADELSRSLERLIQKKHGIRRATAQRLLKRSIKGGDTAGVSLFELVDIVGGLVDPTGPVHRRMPLVAPDHVEEHAGRLLTVESAAEQGAISGKYVFRPGDVVYSKIRPNLRKAFVADFPGLCSADMYVLRPKEGVDSRYVLSVLLSEDFTRFAVSCSARSGIPKVNRTELSQYRFVPHPEGRRDEIGDILRDMDADIAAYERRLAKTRDVKLGMMQELLTGRTRLSSEGAAA